MSALTKGQFLKNGTRLEKEFDRAILPALDASVGGTLRKYCDTKVIDGESLVETYGTGGNYTSTRPNLYGATGVDQYGLAGGTRSWEVTPKYVYSYEILTAEEMRGLTITTDSWFITNMIQALEIGEDIEIVKALEEVDAFLPAANKIVDETKPIYHPEQIMKLKATLVYANSRFKGVRQKANSGAFMLINALDWAKVVLENRNGGIFASSEYAQVTGLDGITYTTVCGVVLETCDKYDKKYGDGENGGAAGRDYLVNPGTARICVMNNIKFVSWENDTLREVKESLLNGHTLAMEVAKSMGAKVKDTKGVWLFKFKAENTISEMKDLTLGSEENPITTKAGL